MTAAALIRGGLEQPMSPWTRYLLGADAWGALVAALATDPDPVLLGLWADPGQVHALFSAADSGGRMADAPLMASVQVEAGRFDALSPARPAAALFERMVHDLWGHLATQGAEPAPLLDHGRWPVLRPLSARPLQNAAAVEQPEFAGAVGHELHQTPIGPIAEGMTAPVHLRLTSAGETVVRLETRMGYAHRGVLAAMRGKPLPGAARLAARIAGDSTVAHAVAFARAAEAATGTEPPPRAHALRGVMAELERIATHLSDLGTAVPGFMEARCMELREDVLRASDAAFGHRLMMDCVVPGGTACDLSPDGADLILAALDRVASEYFAMLRRVGRLRSRGVGVIGGNLVARFAPGGVVGRAAGRAGDARRWPGYPPYDPPASLTQSGGDVDARLRVRLGEIRQSFGVLPEWLASLPPGPVHTALPAMSGEGLGVAEGPRGDIWHWLQLDAGTVAASFVRDPAWLHWPLIEAACSGAPLADVPMILRSFSPCVAGMEL